ncbi:hypothetical protein JCM3774_005048 [Rhodotorula dairenensis]
MVPSVVAIVAFVAAASLTTPVLATPPPDLIEALSAYAAAGATPTFIAAADHARMVRRAEETLKTAAVSRAPSHEEIVILPSGHRPYKQLPDSFKRGTRMVKEARGLVEDDHDDKNTTTTTMTTTTTTAIAEEETSKTSSSSVAAATSSSSSSRKIDSHHYWYLEDSPDQARWRNAKQPPPAAKRALGHFFDNLQHDFDRSTAAAAAATNVVLETHTKLEAKGSGAPTGFRKVSLRARAESSSGSPIDSSSTSSPTPAPAVPVSTSLTPDEVARSVSLSQAADNLTWYDPTTWPSGVAAEVTQETDSLKDSIRKMNLLSKIGLATLVLVSTICLGFLIYCLCKLNLRRRRRSAAERVAAKLQANPPTRPYGGSATVPMTSTGFSSRASTPAPSDKKGKRRMSWSSRG